MIGHERVEMESRHAAGGYGPPGGGGYGGPPPGGGGGGYGGPPPGGGGYGGPPPGGGGYGGPPPGGGGYGGPPGGGPPGFGPPGGGPPGGYGQPPGGYGQPPGGYGPPGYGQPGGMMPGGGGQKFHPLAIVSLITGILSIPLCCCSWLGIWAPITAVVCGIVGMQKIKSDTMNFKGNGFCIAGIVTGGVGLMLDLLAIFTAIDENLKGTYGGGHF